jgi:hypothetical protein
MKTLQIVELIGVGDSFDVGSEKELSREYWDTLRERTVKVNVVVHGRKYQEQIKARTSEHSVYAYITPKQLEKLL